MVKVKQVLSGEEDEESEEEIELTTFNEGLIANLKLFLSFLPSSILSSSSSDVEIQPDLIENFLCPYRKMFEQVNQDTSQETIDELMLADGGMEMIVKVWKRLCEMVDEKNTDQILDVIRVFELLLDAVALPTQFIPTDQLDQYMYGLIRVGGTTLFQVLNSMLRICCSSLPLSSPPLSMNSAVDRSEECNRPRNVVTTMTNLVVLLYQALSKKAQTKFIEENEEASEDEMMIVLLIESCLPNWLNCFMNLLIDQVADGTAQLTCSLSVYMKHLSQIDIIQSIWCNIESLSDLSFQYIQQVKTKCKHTQIDQTLIEGSMEKEETEKKKEKEKGKAKKGKKGTTPNHSVDVDALLQPAADGLPLPLYVQQLFREAKRFGEAVGHLGSVSSQERVLTFLHVLLYQVKDIEERDGIKKQLIQDFFEGMGMNLTDEVDEKEIDQLFANEESKEMKLHSVLDVLIALFDASFQEVELSDPNQSEFLVVEPEIMQEQLRKFMKFIQKNTITTLASYNLPYARFGGVCRICDVNIDLNWNHISVRFTKEHLIEIHNQTRERGEEEGVDLNALQLLDGDECCDQHYAFEYVCMKEINGTNENDWVKVKEGKVTEKGTSFDLYEEFEAQPPLPLIETDVEFRHTNKQEQREMISKLQHIHEAAKQLKQQMKDEQNQQETDGEFPAALPAKGDVTKELDDDESRIASLELGGSDPQTDPVRTARPPSPTLSDTIASDGQAEQEQETQEPTNEMEEEHQQQQTKTAGDVQERVEQSMDEEKEEEEVSPVKVRSTRSTAKTKGSSSSTPLTNKKTPHPSTKKRSTLDQGLDDPFGLTPPTPPEQQPEEEEEEEEQDKKTPSSAKRGKGKAKKSGEKASLIKNVKKGKGKAKGKSPSSDKEVAAPARILSSNGIRSRRRSHSSEGETTGNEEEEKMEESTDAFNFEETEERGKGKGKAKITAKAKEEKEKEKEKVKESEMKRPEVYEDYHDPFESPNAPFPSASPPVSATSYSPKSPVSSYKRGTYSKIKTPKLDLDNFDQIDDDRPSPLSGQATKSIQIKPDGSGNSKEKSKATAVPTPRRSPRHSTSPVAADTEAKAEEELEGDSEKEAEAKADVEASHKNKSLKSGSGGKPNTKSAVKPKGKRAEKKEKKEKEEKAETKKTTAKASESKLSSEEEMMERIEEAAKDQEGSEFDFNVGFTPSNKPQNKKAERGKSRGKAKTKASNEDKEDVQEEEADPPTPEGKAKKKTEGKKQESEFSFGESTSIKSVKSPPKKRKTGPSTQTKVTRARKSGKTTRTEKGKTKKGQTQTTETAKREEELQPFESVMDELEGEGEGAAEREGEGEGEGEVEEKKKEKQKPEEKKKEGSKKREVSVPPKTAAASPPSEPRHFGSRRPIRLRSFELTGEEDETPTAEFDWEGVTNEGIGDTLFDEDMVDVDTSCVETESTLVSRIQSSMSESSQYFSTLVSSANSKDCLKLLIPVHTQTKQLSNYCKSALSLAKSVRGRNGSLAVLNQVKQKNEKMEKYLKASESSAAALNRIINKIQSLIKQQDSQWEECNQLAIEKRCQIIKVLNQELKPWKKAIIEVVNQDGKQFQESIVKVMDRKTQQ